MRIPGIIWLTGRMPLDSPRIARHKGWKAGLHPRLPDGMPFPSPREIPGPAPSVKTGIGVMFLTYRYKLKPTAVQRDRLFTILKEDRELYNAALEERQTQYLHSEQKHGPSKHWKELGIKPDMVTVDNQQKSLTKIRGDDPERAFGHATRQRGPLFRLERAYQAFFRRLKEGKKPGFPKFKGAKFWKTIEIAEQYRVKGSRFHSKEFKPGIRFNPSRPIPEGSRHCGALITLTAKGWYLNLRIEIPTPEPKPVEEVTFPIGIDMGLNALVARSDGTLIPPPQFERKAHKRIRRLQRLVARSKKGSNSSKRKKGMLARAHLKVRNRRKDFLHKLSTDVCREHDLVVHEDLTIRNMARNKRLSRSIHDASWGMFLQMVGYKAVRGGTHAVSVRAHGTSQECSGCGVVVSKSLGTRTHRCGDCGLVLDRDVNAAINVLQRAGTALPPVTHGQCVSDLPKRETWVGANNMQMTVQSCV